MTSHRPYVIVAPYLPLKKRVDFGGWIAGPPDSFAGQWKDGTFERHAKSFLSKFRDANGKEIKKPALIARTDVGLDGRLPGELELEALQLALQFGTLNANPNWHPDADGWWVATSDNSEIWAQPIDIDEGRIALERGSLVTVTSGGGKTGDPDFEIPAPRELHLPLDARLDGEAANAIYRVAISEHDGFNAPLGRRVSTAVRWLAKSWRNTPSLGPEDRIVMLRTAFETLTGTSHAQEAIDELEATFGALKGLGATAESTKHLLWSPDETPHRDFKFVGKGGLTKTFRLSNLGHWFSTFGSARHLVVHEGLVPALSYNETGSRYNGPFFHIGERLLREAVSAALTRFGYTNLWQDEWGRVTEKVLARLASQEQGEGETP